MPKKFLRRSWDRYSKLGKGRKKKQKWRKPTGRDNKMREKRKGYPKVVSIGYKKKIGKINKKNFIIIKNIKDLENLKKNQIAIISNIGKKKKIEIVKKAKEMKISLHNINIKSFLKEIEKSKPKKAKEQEEKKTKKEGKKESKEKKKIAESKDSEDKKTSKQKIKKSDNLINKDKSVSEVNQIKSKSKEEKK